VAKDVLAIVCSTCGEICGFHHDSLEVIQKAVRRAGKNPYTESDLVSGLTPENAHADEVWNEFFDSNDRSADDFMDDRKGK